MTPLEINKIHQGDCFELMKKIPSGIIDLILTDPPYGTIKGLGGDIKKYKNLSESEWDIKFNPEVMFEECERVLRERGRLILFSQEPYTSKLIVKAHNNLPFNYRLIWLKDHFANCLVVNKAPVNYFEDIVVFTKRYDTLNLNPLRVYSKKILDYTGLNIKQINKILGHRKAEHFFYVNSTQFDMCTEETYLELTNLFDLKSMCGFLSFVEIQKINKKHEVIFNLQKGQTKKSNVLQYKKDYDGLHPTQKPIKLLKDLIQTYSHKGDLVLDFTCGSGSTNVACELTGRKHIGIETEKKYIDIANKRLSQKSLFQLCEPKKRRMKIYEKTKTIRRRRRTTPLSTM